MLASATAVYALKFPTLAALQMFETVYKYRQLESTSAMYDYKRSDEVNGDTIACSKDHACTFSAWHSWL